jgi:hypothetical protein
MKHLYLKKIEIDNENLSPSPPPLPSREGETHPCTPLKRGFPLSTCGSPFEHKIRYRHRNDVGQFPSPCGLPFDILRQAQDDIVMVSLSNHQGDNLPILNEKEPKFITLILVGEHSSQVPSPLAGGG